LDDPTEPVTHQDSADPSKKHDCPSPATHENSADTCKQPNSMSEGTAIETSSNSIHSKERLELVYFKNTEKLKKTCGIFNF